MQIATGMILGVSSRPTNSRCIPACVQVRASSGFQPARPSVQRRVKTFFAPDKTPEVITPTGVRAAPRASVRTTFGGLTVRLMTREELIKGM